MAFCAGHLRLFTMWLTLMGHVNRKDGVVKLWDMTSGAELMTKAILQTTKDTCWPGGKPKKPKRKGWNMLEPCAHTGARRNTRSRPRSRVLR